MQFSSLPRPVGRAFAAAWWSTAPIFVWLTVWVLAHGGLPVGDAGASVPGQQLAAAAWMMHLIVVRHRLKRLNHNPRHSQDRALGPRERQQLMRRRNARLSMNIAVRVA
jgi:hypothetical protein